MSTSIGFDIFARDRASAPMGRVGASATALDGKFHRLRSAGAAGAAGFDRMASGALRLTKAVGTGLLIGLGAATAAAYKLAEGAAEDDKAARLLALTSENAAGATRKQIAAQEDWISKIGLAKGVADDELRPALSRLIVATGDVSRSQHLAALAMDISAGSGKGLDTVTTALAKAQTGSLGGLSRLGVATKDAAGETLTLAQITQNLADKYNGAAAAGADTAAGKFARLKIGMAELGESIGYKVLPYATRLIDFLVGPASAGAEKLWRAFDRNGIDGLVSKVEKMTGTSGRLTPVLDKARTIFTDVSAVVVGSVIPAFTDAGGIFDIAKAAGDKLVSVLGFLADHSTLTKAAIIGLVATLTTAKVATIAWAVASKAAAVAAGVWTAAQWLLNAALTANPIGVVIVAVGALAAGLVLAYNKSETFRNVVNGAWEVVKKGKPLLLGLLGPIGLIAGALIVAYQNSETFRRVAKGAFDAIGRAGTWLWNNALQPAFKFILTGFGYLMQAWSKVLGALGHVPGFGWAKDASKAMAEGAQKAKDMAAGINKIPDQKNFKLNYTIQYNYKGLRDGGGATRGRTDDFAPSSRRMAESNSLSTLGSAGSNLLASLVAGIRKGVNFDRAFDAFKTARDSQSAALDALKTARLEFIRDFRSFTSSVFATPETVDGAGNTIKPTLDSMLLFAKAQLAQATDLKSDISKLISLGLSDDLLAELKDQGAAGISQIHTLATGTAAQVAEFNRLTAERNAQEDAAGAAIAAKLEDPAIAREENARATYDAVYRAFVDAQAGRPTEDLTLTLDGDKLTAVQKKKNRHRGRGKK